MPRPLALALHDEVRTLALTPSLTPTLPLALAPAGHSHQVSRQGHAHFSFTAFEPLQVKGYSEPVVFYHPQQSGHVAKARLTPCMPHPLACLTPGMLLLQPLACCTPGMPHPLHAAPLACHTPYMLHPLHATTPYMLQPLACHTPLHASPLACYTPCMLHPWHV